MQPVKVTLSRASTASYDGHGTLNADVTGGMIAEPELGKPLRVFLDNGRIVETTAIQRIVRTGSKWLIATRNSLYQLVFKEPLAA